METAIYMLYYAATVKLLLAKVSLMKVFSMVKNQATLCPHDF